MLENYPDILKTKEVADILRVCTATVRKMIKEGDLVPTFKDRSYKFKKETIIDFIEKRVN